MVTETIPIQEQEPKISVLDVREVGERIGIPVVVRPWWGSRRRLFETQHTKCGNRVFRDHNGWWCYRCGRCIDPEYVKRVRLKPGRWECPARFSQQLKWPTVVGDKVIMWEGRCRAPYGTPQYKRYDSAIHIHRQTLEVLDFSATAMLVRVSVSTRRLTFLIGQDDGLPFIHVVTRHQTTVAEAFDYMVPVPVFNAMMHGFYCPRQGDFFFVPREFWGNGCIRATEKAPAPLPQNRRPENPNWDQNRPYINVPIQGTRHVAELFIFHIPYDMVKGAVTAPDHPPLQMETWHCAIRNKRSSAVNPDSRFGDD